MQNRTIAQLLAGLRQQEYSSTELCRDYLDGIADRNPTLNAFISVD